MGVTDDRVREGVVDDAGVADHHDHRTRAGQLEALDLQSQAHQQADSSKVAAQPAALDVVDALPPALAVPATCSHPDREQAQQAVHLADEEPPQHRHQSHRHPVLAPPQPQRQVDACGDEQQKRGEDRQGEQEQGLRSDAPRAPPEP